MQELIPVQQRIIGDSAVSAVDARTLHVFLGVGRDFSTWIKDRVKKYEFVENVDFITHSPKSVNGDNQGVTQFTPGFLRLDYYVTMDMAKELSMIEHTPRSKQARQYFIQCEKRLHAMSGKNPPAQNPVKRLCQPNLLHGFPKGTTMSRLIREERQLVGQGVHDFGLTPEAARERAIELMADRYGDNPAFLFRGLPVIVPLAGCNPERRCRSKAKKVKVAQVTLLDAADMQAASTDNRAPQTASLVEPLAGCKPVFCGVQELAGLIPKTFSSGQPDGQIVNDALIDLGFAYRRSNGVYPLLPQADGRYQMKPIPAATGKFFAVWDRDFFLPILRTYFAAQDSKPSEKPVHTHDVSLVSPEQITLM